MLRAGEAAYRAPAAMTSDSCAAASSCVRHQGERTRATGDGSERMPDQVACGPIDFVLLEFPEDIDGKACVDAVMDSVNRGVIRLYDVLVIRKALDGSSAGIDLADVTPAGVGGFTAFEGARSGMIHDDDVSAVAEVMRPGTIAALIDP